MRVRHKANVVIASDAAGKDKLYAPDDTLAEVVLDGFTEASSGTVQLALDGSFTVPFGGLATCRGVFLKATGGDFTVALNGLAPLSVKRGATAGSGAVATTARVFLEAQVTSVVVVAGAALTLQYALWGDPLP